ncbi:MAG: IclR family transcriptional regulator [Terriglobia bacterium]
MRRHTIMRDGPSTATLARRPAPRYSYRINVLDRAFQILEYLSDAQRGCQLADLSRNIKVPKSTVHRILMVLERHRYVRREPGDGKFRLGSKALQLESSAVAGMDITEVCRPFLRQLVAETGETAHLGVLCDRQVISLANEQSWRTLTPSTIGRSVPAYCTSLGKALLAWIPENELDEYLLVQKRESRTANTIIRGEKLKAELRKIRQRGYSIDNQEFEEGLKCVAAAARNRSGQIAAAIGIAGPVSRLGRARMGPAAKSVVNAAAGLSEALGYRAGERRD